MSAARKVRKPAVHHKALTGAALCGSASSFLTSERRLVNCANCKRTKTWRAAMAVTAQARRESKAAASAQQRAAAPVETKPVPPAAPRSVAEAFAPGNMHFPLNQSVTDVRFACGGMGAGNLDPDQVDCVDCLRTPAFEAARRARAAAAPAVSVDLGAQPAPAERASMPEGPIHRRVDDGTGEVRFRCGAGAGHGNFHLTNCKDCKAIEKGERPGTWDPMLDDTRRDNSGMRLHYELRHAAECEPDPARHAQRRAQLPALLDQLGADDLGLEAEARWTLEQRLAYQERRGCFLEAWVTRVRITDAEQELKWLAELREDALAEQVEALDKRARWTGESLDVYRDMMPDSVERLQAADRRAVALGLEPMAKDDSAATLDRSGLDWTPSEAWDELVARAG